MRIRALSASGPQLHGMNEPGERSGEQNAHLAHQRHDAAKSVFPLKHPAPKAAQPGARSLAGSQAAPQRNAQTQRDANRLATRASPQKERALSAEPDEEDARRRIEVQLEWPEQSREWIEQETGDVPGELASKAVAGFFDAEALAAEIARLGADEGIFELLLPDGAVVGVVASVEAGQASFMLSTSDTMLSRQLQRRQMELKARLQRRMGRSVKLVVLPESG